MKKATNEEIFTQIEKVLQNLAPLKEEIFELEMMLSIDFLNFQIERAHFEEFLKKLKEAYKPF